MLHYDNRFNHDKGRKFLLRWEGPFVVIKKYSNGSYKLGDLDGLTHRTTVNGWRLKPYHCRIAVAKDLGSSNDEEHTSSTFEEPPA